MSSAWIHSSYLSVSGLMMKRMSVSSLLVFNRVHFSGSSACETKTNTVLRSAVLILNIQLKPKIKVH